MAEQKQSNKERLKEITEGIEKGIQELFESDKYRQYLSTMSRFHRYSVNNTMLIYMQRPDATLVAGFNKWRDQFERHVKRGEHGITIIAPTPYKKKIEQEKLDPDTKAPMLDADGKVIIEEKTIEIPMFKPVKVFDVSQTDGKPLPQLASDLTGDVQNYEVFMEALRRSSAVPIYIRPIHDGSDGFFSLDDQSITIREGMSEIQTVSAVVHEIAHSKLHNNKLHGKLDTSYTFEEAELFGKPALFLDAKIDSKAVPDGLYRYELRGSAEDSALPAAVGTEVSANFMGTIITSEPIELVNGFAELDNSFVNFGGNKTIKAFYEEIHPEAVQKSRNTEEVEAESISYAVCAYYGIETGENSFGYIAGWSQDKALTELRASLETISKTSSELITDIDRNYREICKERGIDPSARQEVAVDPITQLATDIDQFSFDFDTYGYGDAVDDREQAIAQLVSSIQNKDVQYLRDWLQPIVEDADGEYSVQAQTLIERLNEFAPVPATKSTDREEASEELYLVDDSMYLHVQQTDEGWDYSLYDKETKKLIDGGVLDNETVAESPIKRPIAAARTEIFQLQGITPTKVIFEDIALLEQLQDAQMADFSAAEEITASTPVDVPAAPEQALDEYPMPDPGHTVADLEAVSYMDGDMLPLSREIAMELYEKDFTIYAITNAGKAEMIFDVEDFTTQADGVLFAVEREEWETSPDFHQRIVDRLGQQEQREQAFLQHSGDAFAIYQQTDGSPGRFRSFDEQKNGVERSGYNLVYTGTLPEGKDTGTHLNTLWHKFNVDHPVDYHRPSLSVSDIVALKVDGVVSCHYVDSFGYKDVSEFIPPENYLKAAEMTIEDDYNMIDGIINNGTKQTVAELEQQARSGQPISLMDLAEAVHREEKEKKKSVVEQLKSQQKSKQEHKKTAHKKRAELEV